MSCESGWTITAEGSVPDAGPDTGFARAMATIVHLNPPGERETVTRRLTPQRWGLGWQADARRVVIAEARYRTLHEALSDVDVALVRMLCEARTRPLSGPAPIEAPAEALPEAANDHRVPPTAARAQAVPMALPAATALAPPQAEPEAEAEALVSRLPEGETAPRPQPAWHWLLPASIGLVLALAGGGLWFTQWQHAEELAAEARRLQQVSQATLVQGTAAALDRGDYGELQFELDRFQALRYFDAAVVLNARGQVVSKSGTALGVRIGETPSQEAVAGSRALDLRNVAGQALGRLLVWPLSPS